VHWLVTRLVRVHFNELRNVIIDLTYCVQSGKMTLGTVLEISYHLGIKFAKSEKIKENRQFCATNERGILQLSNRHRTGFQELLLCDGSFEFKCWLKLKYWLVQWQYVGSCDHRQRLCIYSYFRHTDRCNLLVHHILRALDEAF
jgi:hypothetical protein